MDIPPQAGGIAAPRALMRDRYWGYHHRQVKKGVKVETDEFLTIADTLNINITDAQSIVDAMPRILIAQTFIRSVTGIPNDKTIIDDKRLEKWFSIARQESFPLTHDLNENREKTLLFAMHNHAIQGEQEFEFGPSLVEEFRHTEVDDILCHEVKVPYDTFYLRFQGLEGKTFEGMPLDGFLVCNIEGEGMHIYPLSNALMSAWRDMDEKGHCTYVHMTVENCQNPEKPFVEMSHGIISNLNEMIDAVLKETKNEGPPQEWIDKVVSNHETARDIIQSQHTEWMRLIVNGLLTIDSGGIEPQNAYPAGAPEQLAQKALSERPGARKADQRLRAEGYVRLKRYEVPKQTLDSSITGKSVTPHWRRGHWRRQHYGQGNSLVRRIRIAPVIVGGHKGDPAHRKGYKI